MLLSKELKHLLHFMPHKTDIEARTEQKRGFQPPGEKKNPLIITVFLDSAMEEGSDTRDDVVRERHGLGPGLLVEPGVLLEVAVEKAIPGAPQPLASERSLQPPWRPPKPFQPFPSPQQ